MVDVTVREDGGGHRKPAPCTDGLVESAGGQRVACVEQDDLAVRAEGDDVAVGGVPADAVDHLDDAGARLPGMDDAVVDGAVPDPVCVVGEGEAHGPHATVNPCPEQSAAGPPTLLFLAIALMESFGTTASAR
ncbi:hypothetical protein ACIBJF_32490 [Streptomyces sp. NPDC050743]|uniref:hypothetical protein n=1 Tax=Streptomyces sp. NPDC050743 TaxID=3365634 RepID=UPI0037B0F877